MKKGLKTLGITAENSFQDKLVRALPKTSLSVRLNSFWGNSFVLMTAAGLAACGGGGGGSSSTTASRVTAAANSDPFANPALGNQIAQLIDLRPADAATTSTTAPQTPSSGTTRADLSNVDNFGNGLNIFILGAGTNINFSAGSRAANGPDRTSVQGTTKIDILEVYDSPHDDVITFNNFGRFLPGALADRPFTIYSGAGDDTIIGTEVTLETPATTNPVMAAVDTDETVVVNYSLERAPITVTVIGTNIGNISTANNYTVVHQGVGGPYTDALVDITKIVGTRFADTVRMANVIRDTTGDDTETLDADRGDRTDIFVFSGGDDTVSGFTMNNNQGGDNFVNLVAFNLTGLGDPRLTLAVTNGSLVITIADEIVPATMHTLTLTGFNPPNRGIPLKQYFGNLQGFEDIFQFAFTTLPGNDLDLSNTNLFENIENIVGSSAVNMLTGNADNNVITTGAGADTVFISGGNDRITDFNPAEDIINLSGLQLSGVSDTRITFSIDGSDLLLSIVDHLDPNMVHTLRLDDYNPGPSNDATLETYFSSGTPAARFTVTAANAPVAAAAFTAVAADQALIGTGNAATVTYATANASTHLSIGRIGDLEGRYLVVSRPLDNGMPSYGTDTLQNIATIIGGAANDIFFLNNYAGDLTINGVAGSDVISYINWFDDEDLAFAIDGSDITINGREALSFTAIEMLALSRNNDSLTHADTGISLTFLGGAGNDTITGNNADDRASYTDGARRDRDLTGDGIDVTATADGFSVNGAQVGLGRDTLVNITDITGSYYADTFRSNANDNKFDGEAGMDLVSYQASTTRGEQTIAVTVNAGSITVDATAIGLGTDTLTNIEMIRFRDDDDIINVTSVANTAFTIFTGDGDDTFNGGGGNEVIHTCGGDDVINAGLGNDVIYGGEGMDTLNGGAGDDIFILIGSNGRQFNYTEAQLRSTSTQGGVNIGEVVFDKLGLTLQELNSSGGYNEYVVGETFDGGAGNDELVIFGEVDLSAGGANVLNNISTIVINSRLTVTADQVSGVALVGEDSTSSVVLAATGSDVSLGDLMLQGQVSLSVSDGVTVTVNQAQITALAAAGTSLTFVGDGGAVEVADDVTGFGAMIEFSDMQDLTFQRSPVRMVSADELATLIPDSGGAPEFGNVIVDSLRENSSANSAAYIIEVSDSDSALNLNSFTLLGTDSALLEIAGYSSGRLTITLKDSADFEMPANADTDNVYDFTIRATDDANNTTDHSANITILDDVGDNPFTRTQEVVIGGLSDGFINTANMAATPQVTVSLRNILSTEVASGTLQVLGSDGNAIAAATVTFATADFSSGSATTMIDFADLGNDATTDGAYTVVVNVTLNDTDSTVISERAALFRDTTAPVLTANAEVSGLSAETPVGTVLYRFTAGEDVVYNTMLSGTTFTGGTADDADNFALSADGVLTLTDALTAAGTYSITVNATDLAGNAATAVEVEVVVSGVTPLDGGTVDVPVTTQAIAAQAATAEAYDAGENFYVAELVTTAQDDLNKLVVKRISDTQVTVNNVTLIGFEAFAGADHNAMGQSDVFVITEELPLILIGRDGTDVFEASGVFGNSYWGAGYTGATAEDLTAVDMTPTPTAIEGGVVTYSALNSGIVTIAGGGTEATTVMNGTKADSLRHISSIDFSGVDTRVTVNLVLDWTDITGGTLDITGGSGDNDILDISGITFDGNMLIELVDFQSFEEFRGHATNHTAFEDDNAALDVTLTASGIERGSISFIFQNIDAYIGGSENGVGTFTVSEALGYWAVARDGADTFTINGIHGNRFYGSDYVRVTDEINNPTLYASIEGTAGADVANYAGISGDITLGFDTDLRMFTVMAGGNTDMLGHIETINFTGDLPRTVKVTDAFVNATTGGTVPTINLTGNFDTLDFSAITTALAIDLSSFPGYSGFETIIGTSLGDDAITAGGSDITIDGGGGNDTLTGDANGADTFVISDGAADTINTFDPTMDKLAFRTSLDRLTFARIDADTLTIVFGDNDENTTTVNSTTALITAIEATTGADFDAQAEAYFRANGIFTRVDTGTAGADTFFISGGQNTVNDFAAGQDRMNFGSVSIFDIKFTRTDDDTLTLGFGGANRDENTTFINSASLIRALDAHNADNAGFTQADAIAYFQANGRFVTETSLAASVELHTASADAFTVVRYNGGLPAGGFEFYDGAFTNVAAVAGSASADTFAVGSELSYTLVGEGGNDSFSITGGVHGNRYYGDSYQFAHFSGVDIAAPTGTNNFDSAVLTTAITGLNIVVSTGSNRAVVETTSYLADGDAWRYGDDTLGLILGNPRTDSNIGQAFILGSAQLLDVNGARQATVAVPAAPTLAGSMNGFFGDVVRYGDFNNDGLIDVVVVANDDAEAADGDDTSNGLSIYYNDGDSDPYNTAANKVDITPHPGIDSFKRFNDARGRDDHPDDVESFESVIVGDFNGDGIDDMLITSIYQGNYYYATRAGQYIVFGKDRSNIATHQIVTRQVNPDNTVSYDTGDAATVFYVVEGYGGSHPQFVQGVTPRAASRNTFSSNVFSLGDINGDGADDFATAPNSGRAIQVFYGNKDAGKTGGTGFTGELDDFGDAQGAGQADRFDFANVAFLADSNPLSSFGQSIRAAALGDINNDGIDDFALTHLRYGKIAVVFGVANGGNPFEGIAQGGVGLSSDDYNLTGADPFGGNNRGFIITTRSPFDPPVFRESSVASPIGEALTGIGDFNGDGIDDFAFDELKFDSLQNGTSGGSTPDSRGQESTAESDAIYIVFGQNDASHFGTLYDPESLVAQGLATRIPHNLLDLTVAQRNGISNNRSSEGVVNLVAKAGHTIDLHGIGDVDGDGFNDIGIRVERVAAGGDPGDAIARAEYHIIYGGTHLSPRQAIRSESTSSGGTADTVTYDGLAGALRLIGNSDAFTVASGSEKDFFADVEILNFTGTGNLDITADLTDITVMLGDGNDKFINLGSTPLIGRAGLTINGGDGDDMIRGSGQDDILIGGVGNDTFILYKGTDIIRDFQYSADSTEPNDSLNLFHYGAFTNAFNGIGNLTFTANGSQSFHIDYDNGQRATVNSDSTALVTAIGDAAGDTFDAQAKAFFTANTSVLSFADPDPQRIGISTDGNGNLDLDDTFDNGDFTIETDMRLSFFDDSGVVAQSVFTDALGDANDLTIAVQADGSLLFSFVASSESFTVRNESGGAFVFDADRSGSVSQNERNVFAPNETIDANEFATFANFYIDFA